MATRQTITKALLDLQHMANSPINDMNVDRVVSQYEIDLGDIPDEIIGAAVIHYRTGSNQFFPSSGQLREKATELYLMAMDIPTAHQAWSQVVTAIRFVDSVMCPECESCFKSIDGKSGREYWNALELYRNHTDSCTVYSQGGFKEVYDHSIVKDIVRDMGGRERLLDGDMGVCRSLFIRGYNEIMLNKVKRATIAAPAREAVIQIRGTNESIAMLAAGMSK